jgi:hypothetical protein
MADLWNNALVNPAFRNNPPAKVQVPAKTLGLVLAILAGIGALFQIFAVITAFTWANALDSLCSYYGNCVSHSGAIAGLGALVVLAGQVLAVWGGYQMYKEVQQGKAFVIYGMLLALIGNVVYAVGWGFGYYVVGFIFSLIIYGIVYYFVVISRWSWEARLTPTAAPYGAGGGYPPQQYPPQQPQYPPQQGYQQPPQQPLPPQQPPQQPPGPPGPPA